jgi:hypothetical protein
MPFSARAIRVADVWIIEIPSLRLRVPVTDLSEVEPRVAAAVAAAHRNRRRMAISVEIGQYLHVDDSTTEETRRRRETVAHALRGSRVS